MNNKTKLIEDQFDTGRDNEIDVVPGSADRQACGETLERVMNRAIERRAFLKGTSATITTLVVTPALLAPKSSHAENGILNHYNKNTHGGRLRLRDPGRRLQFETVPPGNEPDIVVPPNYSYNVILKWGDPLFSDTAKFDVDNQTAASQAQQFGFNCDLVLWYPLPSFVVHTLKHGGRISRLGRNLLGSFFPIFRKRHSRRALIAVNHEYTTGVDMFPGYDGDSPTAEQVAVEIEAHGVTIAELIHNQGEWHLNKHSAFNRRLTGTTEMEITGPLRGHELMKSSYDASGKVVKGTFNNCAGGQTPWGTILSCEENFDQYFGNNDLLDATHPSKQVSKRIPPEGGETDRKWERYDERFDVSKEPNEYNRFGYVVEVDPYDPESKPLKRTALGRFKHEGAVPSIADDGSVAVYTGDDARFEYLYKFISSHKYQRRNRKHNMKLLEEGVLYAARFSAGDEAGDDMGMGEWLPLVWEPGNRLDQAFDDSGNKLFNNQQEVLLKTRLAADVLGATPMDRPEDVDVHPNDKRVYMTLTNNSKRTEKSVIDAFSGREQAWAINTGPDESNPRPNNQHGHIIEIIEQDSNPTALNFRWNIFIKCGRPDAPDDDARYGDITDPVAAGVSPISDPDNVVFDDYGNLWIATDGQFFSGDYGFGQNDGVFAVPTEGEDRGKLRQFLSGIPGAEICGPEFSGDDRTFFCAIQHPKDKQAFADPWPIGEPVAKPSLIGVQEKNGKKIGA